LVADTFSNTLGFLVMGTGNDNNTWGTNANSSDFQIFEDAIANILSETVTGGTLDLSGSPPPAAASQVRHWMISFTGTLGGAQSVKVPNLSKGWWVNNQTSGAFALTFKTPSGSASASIPQGGYTYVWCDGSNNINVSPYSSAGATLASGQYQGPNGSASAPTFSWSAETNSGWYRNGTQDVRLAINGSDILQVTGSGATTASVVNVVAGALQVAGVQVVPPGVEAPYAGILAPTGWLFEYGQAVSRTGATANLLAAITATCTGNTNGNTTINGLSTDLRGLGLEGAFIEGTGISLATTIVSIASASSMTVSATVSGTNTGVSLRILPYGQGDGSTTYNVPDRRGRSVFGRDNMGGSAASRITTNSGTHLATAGGEETHTLVTSEIPAITPSGTIGGSQTLGWLSPNNSPGNIGSGSQIGQTPLIQAVVSGSNFTFTGNSFGGGGAHNNMPPFGMSNMIIKL
jgi:microcystin-dependent protein